MVIIIIIVNVIVCHHLNMVECQSDIIFLNHVLCNRALIHVWGVAGFLFCVWEKYSSTLPHSVNILPLVLFNAIKIVLYKKPHRVFDCLFLCSLWLIILVNVLLCLLLLQSSASTSTEQILDISLPTLRELVTWKRYTHDLLPLKLWKETSAVQIRKISFKLWHVHNYSG